MRKLAVEPVFAGTIVFNNEWGTHLLWLPKFLTSYHFHKGMFPIYENFGSGPVLRRV